MLQQCVEHERADARRGIDADQVRGEDVGRPVRFRKELRIGSIHLQQVIDKVRRLAVAMFRPMGFHDLFEELPNPPSGALKPRHPFHKPGQAFCDVYGDYRSQKMDQIVDIWCW